MRSWKDKSDVKGFVVAGTRLLTVKIAGDSKGAQNALSSIDGKLAGFGRKLVGLGSLVGGTFALGAVVKGIWTAGSTYEKALNNLQAVTGASAEQMKVLQAKSRALGKDLTLPATSAGDAAAAMLELSKGGLSVTQTMKAAKGTLQLAAAAQVDGARAAEIQANTLAMFSLKGKDAIKVADTLANVSNAASGEIEDFANSLSYVGPLAQSLKIPLGDVATTLGVLAKNGIKGEKAGTAVRGMLAGLSAPSLKAKEALKELNVQSFDSEGHFVGMKNLIGQLAVAQKDMTDKQFASNAAMAFGREPLSAIIALASKGKPAFKQMSKAIEEGAGAADLAAAKNKGLTGALDGLQSQLETVGADIYMKVKKPLEKAVRFAANEIPKIADGFAKLGPLIIEKATPAYEHVKGIGVNLVNAVREGLHDGDWALFGVVLGNAIRQALDGLISVSNKIFSVLGKAIASVKWVDLGMQLGAQVPAMLFGLALGILNFDPMPILIGIKDHWFAVLMAVLGLIFMPARIAGKLVGMLAKIPFAGKLLAWGVKALNDFGGKIKGWIGKAIGKFGSAFMEAIGRTGPGIVGKFKGLIDNIITHVYVWVKDFGKAATALIHAFAEKFGTALGSWAGKAGTKMKNLVVGIGKGAGTWLLKVGGYVVDGLANGIRNSAGKVMDAAKALADHIPGWAKKVLGINSPSKVMEALGIWAGKGFAKGIGGSTIMLLVATYKQFEDLIKAARAGANDLAKANEKLAETIHKRDQRVKDANHAKAMSKEKQRRTNARAIREAHDRLDDARKAGGKGPHTPSENARIAHAQRDLEQAKADAKKRLAQIDKDYAARIAAAKASGSDDIKQATADRDAAKIQAGILATATKNWLAIDEAAQKVGASLSWVTGKIRKTLSDTVGPVASATTAIKNALVHAFTDDEGNLHEGIQSVLDDLDALASQAQSFRQSFIGAFQSATDVVGKFSGDTAVSVESVIETMQGQLEKAQTFAQNIAELSATGLNKDFLQKLMLKGPEDGANLAAALAQADAGQIAAINDTQSAIDGVTTGAANQAETSIYGIGAGGLNISAGGIVVNVNGSVTSERDLAEVIRKAIAESQRRNGLPVTV